MEIQSMKTLYVTDLDGTLLNTKDQIDEESIQIINGLVEQGMLFTYATARSLVSASVVTKGLSTKIPAIVYNGTFIMEPDSGKILSSNFFQQSHMEEVKRILTAYNIYPLVYSFSEGIERVRWLVGSENEGMNRYFSLRQGDKRFLPANSLEELYQGETFYFTCIGEQEDLQPAYEEISKSQVYHCTIQQELYRPEYWFEIMPQGATKANAIKKLKKLWNCDRVVSFGDAINDVLMFLDSDECYAVSNAVPQVKEIATGIIGSNDENSVAKWLRDDFLQK